MPGGLELSMLIAEWLNVLKNVGQPHNRTIQSSNAHSDEVNLHTPEASF